MRVVFVYPCFENLGLEYLSAALRADGVETSLVFDPLLFNDPFVRIGPLARALDHTADLPRQVAARRPDLVCFGVLASSYAWALDLAAGVKGLCPGVPVVFGGVHPTAVPEIVLENPQVDYVVRGEGEQALVQLCRALDGRGTLDGVAGLVWRDPERGLRHNPLPPLCEDLDALPRPDKALFYREVPGFSRHYTVLTRRGCVNQCTYCHNTMWNRLYPGDGCRVRLRSVDDVLDELVQARARHGFERLRINDDLFSYNRDWLIAFCRRYPHEVGRPFYCFASPADLDDAAVAALKRAGCYQVCLGVQDVREEVRREVFGRHTPQRAVERALAALRRHELRATVDNIVGWPGQTVAQMEEIADFYLKNPVYGRYTVFWLIYFAGTALTRRAVEEGIIAPEAARELGREPPRQANTLIGRAADSPELRRVHLLLLLAQMLPPALARPLVQRRLHRLLPPLNPGVVEGVWTLFTRDRLDPVRQRYFAKYGQFGPAALARRLVRGG